MAAAAVCLGIVVGVAIAVSPKLGVALLFAAAYGLILVFARVWALVAFVPLIFLEAVPVLNLAGKAVGLLVAAVWMGAALTRREGIAERARSRRRLFECLAALIVWLCLTALWATDAGRAVGDVWRWVAVGLIFAIISTWVADRRTLLWILAAFVLGAVLAVLSGLSTGVVGAGGADPRLEGGSGDPNFLAAGLVPAMVLAAGVMVAVKDPLSRLGCVVAMMICALGLAATQSHGGVLALLAVGVAALVVFRRRRVYVAIACLGVVAVGAAYFSTTPAAWDRVSHVENGGSGRSDIWAVAWRASKAHPVGGVGLDNYEIVAREYTRQPGALKNVNKIAERPHVVHNTYLEALSETGLIGLALFLLFAFGTVTTAWRAGLIFERLEDVEMEALARAVVVAAIGMMVAAFFISDGVDKRLWVLFGLGPATLCIAERQRRRYEAP